MIGTQVVRRMKIPKTLQILLGLLFIFALYLSAIMYQNYGHQERKAAFRFRPIHSDFQGTKPDRNASTTAQNDGKMIQRQNEQTTEKLDITSMGNHNNATTCKYCVKFKHHVAVVSPEPTTEALDFVYVIPSHYGKGALARRNLIRDTWAHRSAIAPYKGTHVFTMGKRFCLCSHFLRGGSRILVSGVLTPEGEGTEPKIC